MLATARPSVTSLHRPVFAPGAPGYAAEVATFHPRTATASWFSQAGTAWRQPPPDS